VLVEHVLVDAVVRDKVVCTESLNTPTGYFIERGRLRLLT
jgi:hypothetical protein